MVRVCLDQNHWVSLTKARVGREDGAEFTDVLTLLCEAGERGWVSVPLSIEHAMELQHRRDYKSRWELAETMVELSRWHTVRAQKDIVAAEIDQALHDIFGRPAFPRKVQPFGVGANHMYGRQLTNRPLPPELAIPDELRLEIQQLKHDVLQMAALVGAPPEFEAPGYEPSADRPVAVEFAAEQERLRSIRRPRGFHRGELGLRAASVDAYDEYHGADQQGA